MRVQVAGARGRVVVDDWLRVRGSMELSMEPSTASSSSSAMDSSRWLSIASRTRASSSGSHFFLFLRTSPRTDRRLPLKSFQIASVLPDVSPT